METKPPVVAPAPHKNFVPQLLALLSVLLFNLTAYLFYQNLQLQKQITRLTNQAKDVGLAPEPIPTEFQTANWKTYTNTQYNFSFKYPPSWISSSESPRPGNVHDPVQEQSFEVYLVSDFNTYDEWVDGRRQSEVQKPQALQIGGLSAVKIVGKGTRQDGTDFYIIDIVIKYNDKVFNLGGDLRSHDQERINKFSELNNQILSTFKFLDQSTDTPTSTSYTCPSSGYVDCMPDPNAGVRFECTPEAFTWYKANCPNFQGGAL